MSIQSSVQAWIRFTDNRWGGYLEEILRLADRSSGLKPRQALGSVVEHRIFQVLAVRGSTCRDELTSLVPFAEAVVEEIDEDYEGKGDISWVVLLACDLINALQAVGCPVSTQSADTTTRWLPRIRVSREEDRASLHWKLGFAALALEQRPVYYRIAGYNVDGAIPFEVGKTFELNLHGLLGHLAGAVENGATASEVMPAWYDLLRCYGVLTSARMIDIMGLLWVARIIHHQIARQPLAGVADFFHDSIWQAARLSP